MNESMSDVLMRDGAIPQTKYNVKKYRNNTLRLLVHQINKFASEPYFSVLSIFTFKI